jgi:hypothetical protein
MTLSNKVYPIRDNHTFKWVGQVANSSLGEAGKQYIRGRGKGEGGREEIAGAVWFWAEIWEIWGIQRHSCEGDVHGLVLEFLDNFTR